VTHSDGMLGGEPLHRSCRIFLSYARESPEHVERVRQLYELLRDCGVDAHADFVAAEARQDWERWTQQEMSAADRVLVIVSPEYKRRFEGTAATGIGRGVRCEARFIRAHIYKDEESGLQKFLPVLFPGATVADIPDTLQPTIATHYVVSDFTPEGIRPLLRLLTGQPARREPPLQPVFVLPLEHDAPVAALRLCTGTGGPSADDLAWQLANSACTRAEVGVLDLGLEAALGGAAAVVPLVSGRDLLGRWIRALHQEVKAVNGNSRMPRVQARLGLHGQASKTDEVTDSNVAAAFANCETAHAMLGIRAAALVIVASDEFHDLVVDRIVRFPAASAYRPFSGRRCWLAVAGHSVLSRAAAVNAVVCGINR
jgi:hypothetical protein